jgi:hypothetical protein
LEIAAGTGSPHYEDGINNGMQAGTNVNQQRNTGQDGSKIEANNEKVEVLGEKLWASKEELKEEMKTGQEEMKATVSVILQAMKSRREETRGLSGEA